MTLQDLIDIAAQEGSNPKDLHLVMGVSGSAFDVTTADEQDSFNPNWVILTLIPLEEK
jgi:hypothetical protein